MFKLLISLLAASFVTTPLLFADAPAPIQTARFEAKDYSNLFGMPGFSDNALTLHFTLYKGYVKNINLLLETIPKLDTKSPEYAELKRRLGWEFDGMRLHELYFENLGGHTPINKDSSLYQQIVKDFGSFDAWKQDFIATGLMRGIGWSVLYYDSSSHTLVNTWINEHDLGHLVGGKPILVMDVFEHAYLPDYQLDRAKYIDAFFNNINWSVVQDRIIEENKTIVKVGARAMVEKVAEEKSFHPVKGPF